MENFKSTQIKTLCCILVGVLIYFFLPAGQGLTTDGVKMLSIFVPMVLIWLIVGGTGWSCLLAVTMCVMLGLYDGNLTYQMFWGTSMVAMVIPFFMLASVLEESGALEYIVKWIISRKIVHGRPTVFLILFTIAMMFVNIFCHPYICMVLFYKILKQICENIGEKQDGMFYKSHGLLIGTVSTIAETTLPWFRPWVAAMAAVIASYGFPNFNSYTLLKVSGLYAIISVVVMLLEIKLWMRPDTTNFSKYDDEAMRAELKANPMPKRAKVAMIGMMVVLASCLLQSFPILGQTISNYLGGLPAAAPISFLACLFCLISVDGKPLMDIGEAAKKVPWETIMFLGAIMYFATIFGSDQFGVSQALMNILTPVVSKIPVTACYFIALIFASLFTNLASNSVTIIVVAAVFLPAMLNMGMEPAKVLAFGAAILLTGGTGLVTRSANGMAALMYTPEFLEWKGTKRYTIAFCAIMILISIFIIIPLGGTVFKSIL